MDVMSPDILYAISGCNGVEALRDTPTSATIPVANGWRWSIRDAGNEYRDNPIVYRRSFAHGNADAYASAVG